MPNWYWFVCPHPLPPTPTFIHMPARFYRRSVYKMWNESIFNFYTRKREKQIWNMKMTSSAEKQMQLFVRQQCRMLSASICIEGAGFFLFCLGMVASNGNWYCCFSLTVQLVSWHSLPLSNPFAPTNSCLLYAWLCLVHNTPFTLLSEHEHKMNIVWIRIFFLPLSAFDHYFHFQFELERLSLLLLLHTVYFVACDWNFSLSNCLLNKYACLFHTKHHENEKAAYTAYRTHSKLLGFFSSDASTTSMQQWNWTKKMNKSDECR